MAAVAGQGLLALFLVMELVSAEQAEGAVALVPSLASPEATMALASAGIRQQNRRSHQFLELADWY
jgi:hypothetical protein